jgi:hypothetical protein
MAALTGNRNTLRLGAETQITLAIAAATLIHEGALVCVNAGGFAVPGATATTLRAIGRAGQGINNTGANGDKSLSVDRGIFLYANDGTDPAALSDINKTCFIVDDQTVAKTNGTNTRSKAGRISDVTADGVWVAVGEPGID